MLVTYSLTHTLTDSVSLSKLYWCDPGVWRCQLKTYWGCFCCWCWWWGSCWQFVADLEAEVWSKSLTFDQTLSTLILNLKFRGNFEIKAEVRSVFCCWCLVEVLKLNLIFLYSEARLVKILNLDLVEMLMCGWDFEVYVFFKSRSWNCNMFKICELWSCDMNSTLGSVWFLISHWALMCRYAINYFVKQPSIHKNSLAIACFATFES